MMICNNCKQQFQDGLPQCPYCGAPVMQQMYQQGSVPNQQFTQNNFTIPQQAPKKKHGCLIAILVVVGIGLIGAIGGAGKNKRESGKVEVESNSKVSESSVQASDSKTENTQKADELSYEVTDTKFNYYTNSIGSIEYYGIVEILNTGSTNIYLDDCTFDLEDNDGHLLQSDDFISKCPYIIAPGEKGYFYNGLGSNLIDDSVSFDNGIKLVPNYTLEQGKHEIVDYAVSDTDMRTDDYGDIKITGRITNSTDKDDSLVTVNFILYDSNEKVLAVTATTVMDLKAGSTQSFEGTTMFADNSATSESVASYKVIARKTQFQ